jgi:hypothetical protein
MVALSFQFALLALWEAWSDSPTVDEPTRIASGVTGLVRHDLRLNVEHPPLPKVLAAAPVLLARPVIPDGRSWRDADGGSFASDFLSAQVRAGKVREVVFLARLVPIAAGVATGWVAYALSAGLFGRAAGVLAGGLWLTSPFVLGLSHLENQDVPFALATGGACLCLARHWLHPTQVSLALVGVMGGVALLTRVTGLVLVAALAVGIMVAERRSVLRAILTGAVVLLIAWVTVWVGFRIVAPAGSTHPRASIFCYPTRPPAERLVRPIPWPTEYEIGLNFHFSCSFEPTHGYLFGEYWTGPRWWYWPGSMLVKLSASTLTVMVVGLGCWGAIKRGARAPAFFAVVLPAMALAFVTFIAPRPIGLRYLLAPILLGFVAGSPLVLRLLRTRVPAMGRVLVAILGVVQLAFFWESVPGSLAWSAPPFRPAYRLASDSNVDWGQDFYRLRAWAERRRPFIAFNGPLPGSLPQARPIPANARHVTGWVAVSARLLTYRRDAPVAWLRAYCPVGDIRGSILLYHFRDPPHAGPTPDVPAAPCPGRESQRRS